VLPQQKTEVDIERLNIIENVVARKPLSIDEDAVTLGIVNSPPAYSRVHDSVMECDRAVFFLFFEYTSRGVDASVPQYQRRDYCGLFFSHALEHGFEPILVNECIVL
jgi:hypothetical protein